MARSEYLEVKHNEIMDMVNASKSFRNAVASAHGCTDTENTYYFKGTCTYPKRYKVNDEQIKIAKQIKSQSMKETFESNRNNLFFIGMGYPGATNTGDVNNCRIRTVLTNVDAVNIFIELIGCTNISNPKDTTRYIDVDFCFITVKKSNKTVDSKMLDDFQYDYKQLESNTLKRHLEWNKRNILNFVNKELNCNFKEIFIDNYDCNIDDDYTPICSCSDK